MLTNRLVILALPAAPLLAQYTSRAPQEPRFADFAVKGGFAGKPKAPVLVTKGQRLFERRSARREQARKDSRLHVGKDRGEAPVTLSIKHRSPNPKNVSATPFRTPC